MRLLQVLPALGLLLLGTAGAGVAAWATAETRQDTYPIDWSVTLTDRTGAQTFSFDHTFTFHGDQTVKIYYIFNTTALEGDGKGPGGTTIVTKFFANGEKVTGLDDIYENPKGGSGWHRNIFQTEYLKVDARVPIRLQVTVANEPMPEPSAAPWAFRYDAMRWIVESEAPPSWPLVGTLAGGGILAAGGWFWWMGRRSDGASVVAYQGPRGS